MIAGPNFIILLFYCSIKLNTNKNINLIGKTSYLLYSIVVLGHHKNLWQVMSPHPTPFKRNSKDEVNKIRSKSQPQQ